MNILFDTNIVLDLLLDREPFSEHASQLFSYIESGEITGFLAATSVTTIYYLATKVVGKKQANIRVSKLLQLFDVAAVNRVVLENSIKLKFTDFEDAVIHEAAMLVEAQFIITRDELGFKHAKIPVYTPAKFLKLLSAKNS